MDEFIATAVDAGDSAGFSEDAAGGLITGINARYLVDCSDILISNDATDGLIATSINAVNLTGCAEDTVGGLIDAINGGNSVGCSDITV